MDLPKLWGLIRADLARARDFLPNHAASQEAIVRYQEFLDHNELELACDMLEAYAEKQEVSREFWFSLRDAAARMNLFDRMRRYEKYAENFQPGSGPGAITQLWPPSTAR
jgi:hypothetical protein